jgi:chromate transporter
LVGYFHKEFVIRRHWLSEQAFVDLVALCQFLPGRRRAKPDSPSRRLRPGACRMDWLHLTVSDADGAD